jgi:hypothetical protein
MKGHSFRSALLVLLACVGMVRGEEKQVLPSPVQTIYGSAIFVAVAGIHYGPMLVSASNAPLSQDNLRIMLAGAVSTMNFLSWTSYCAPNTTPDQCELDRRRARWLDGQDVAAFVYFAASRKPLPWDPDIYAFCASSVAAKTVIDSPDDIENAGQVSGLGKCTDAMVITVKWPKDL